MWRKGRIQLHSLPHGCPVLPAACVGRMVFSPSSCLSTFIRTQLITYVKVYFRALCSIILSVLTPAAHCFDDHSFVAGFEIRICESSNLVLLFSRLFHQFGVLWGSLWPLRWVVLFCMRHRQDLDRDALNCRCFGWCWHLNNIISSMNMGVFPFIFVIF